MLFLAGEGHGNCEKVRWTRRHPPMGRRGVTEYPKRNGGSENQSRRFMGAWRYPLRHIPCKLDLMIIHMLIELMLTRHNDGRFSNL